jgi:hypothetical protein
VGSPKSAPGPSRVKPIAVLEGLICAIRVSLRIGMEIAVAPELNSPMYAMLDGSIAARRAFRDVSSGVQVPARAVALSSGM